MWYSPFGKDYLYEIIYNIYIYVEKEWLCVWKQHLETIKFFIISIKILLTNVRNEKHY